MYGTVKTLASGRWKLKLENDRTRSYKTPSLTMLILSAATGGAVACTSGLDSPARSTGHDRMVTIEATITGEGAR